MKERLGEAFLEGKGATFDAIKKLGLDLERIKNLDTTSQFLEIADALSKVEDEGELRGAAGKGQRQQSEADRDREPRREPLIQRGGKNSRGDHTDPTQCQPGSRGFCGQPSGIGADVHPPSAPTDFRHHNTERAERDITHDLRGALQPAKSAHFASVTEPKKVAELLRAMDSYEGTLTVRCALRLAPFVFVRPGELRHAEWADIDLDTGEWRYTVTKTDTQHIVPLASQAMEILRELHPLTGRGRYVFPSARSAERPMSNNAILAAMRRMGIGKEEMSGHGFRAMARTILDEVLGFRPDYIEHQLAHAVRDPNGRAYNRTAHLPERRKMMQEWADYLDKLKAGAEVIPINQSA